MNIVDYVILGIIAASVIFGMYRGFLSSVMGAGSTLVSLGLSFAIYPKVAGVIRGNDSLLRTLMHYTDASNRIGDLGTALSPVSSLNGDSIAALVAKVNLPAPFDRILTSNLTNQVFSSSVTTVSDYVSQTILNASINIICFVLTFAVLFILLHLICGLIGKIANLPVLKQLDSLAGGGVGIIRGVLILFVLFTLIPLVLTIVPVDFLSDMIAESKLAGFFSGGNLVMAIMNGKL